MSKRLNLNLLWSPTCQLNAPWGEVMYLFKITLQTITTWNRSKWEQGDGRDADSFLCFVWRWGPVCAVSRIRRIPTPTSAAWPGLWRRLRGAERWSDITGCNTRITLYNLTNIEVWWESYGWLIQHNVHHISLCWGHFKEIQISLSSVHAVACSPDFLQTTCRLMKW